MDTPRYRIGNDLTILWAINNRDGSPFNLADKEVRLFVTHDRGREEVEPVITTLDNGEINNVIRWDFKGDDQRVLGLYTLTVEILTSVDHKEIKRDFCKAFSLVGATCEECTDDGEANVMDGGDLILATRLDIYRFCVPRIEIGPNGNWFIDGVDTGVSALGGGGGGEGLINTVYRKGDFGKTFNEASLRDTFNAYAINELYKRLINLALEDIKGVALQDPNKGDVLYFNGTSWVNTDIESLIPSNDNDNCHWYVKDGKLHVDYDIVVHGNSVVEGDSSSGGEGGAPAVGGLLSSLNDVLINSAANGDVLIYNAQLGKWVNTSQSSIVPDLTGYATQQWVKDQNYLMESSLLPYAKTSYVNSEIKKISDALAAMWQIDENGNLVTDKQVIIKNNLIVNGDTASGGDGQNTVVGITGILVGNSIYKDLDSDGLIDLTKAFEGLSADVDLSNYYTKKEVDNKIAGIDLSPYAKKTELEALQNEVNAIESMLGTDAKDTIDTWNEVVAFLDGYKDSDDLATILSSMNGKIDANTQGIATINNTLSPIKSWYDTLSSLIINDNGNVRIKTNLIVEGDSASGGEGDVTTQGIVGIKVNGTTFYDTNADGIIDLGTISGGGGLTSVSWADIADRPTALSEFENDLSSADIAQILGYTPVRPTTLNNFLPKTGGQLTGALQIFDHLIYDDDGAFSIDSMDTISLYAPNDIVIWSEEGQLYFNDKPVLTEHQSLANYVTNSALSSALSNYQLANTAINTSNIAAQSVAYAANAGAVGGVGIYNGTSGIATITSAGVMEVGQYIDFHKVGSTKDYSVRLNCSNDNGVSIHLPSAQGTLALSSQIPTMLSQLTDNVGYARASSLANYLPLTGGTLSGALTVASTIQSNSVICGTTRLRVNASTSAGIFAFMDARPHSSGSNRSTAHIGSAYGNVYDIANLGGMVAISIYKGSVGVGREFTDAELKAASDGSVGLTVAGNLVVNGDIASA